MSQYKKNKNTKKQKGGGSDFSHSFHAVTVQGGPAAISRATLGVINSTPMFNPLGANTVIPGTSGIVPSGLYLGAQTGGGKDLLNMSVAELRTLCNQHGLSCKNATGEYLSGREITNILQGKTLVSQVGGGEPYIE
jgi:hypothetical protein